MEKNIYVYTLGNKIYINLTNRCTNNCDFCIRHDHKDMDGQVRWIKEEPTVEDVIEQLPQNIDDYENEIVFCGYGEPTFNLDTLDEVASYLHCIDIINVSLNESTAAKYQQHCKSIYGERAYEALIEFAKLCKQRGGNVVFSVVDSIGEKDVAECQKLADKLGIPLRIRVKRK